MSSHNAWSILNEYKKVLRFHDGIHIYKLTTMINFVMNTLFPQTAQDYAVSDKNIQSK